MSKYNILYTKYSKIIGDRVFECDDGWFNILDALCGNIQHHIKHKRYQRSVALIHNRVLKRGLAGDLAGLNWYFNHINDPRYHASQVAKELKNAEYRTVPPKIEQVVIEQVKEKFGALRFYYTGGDEAIDGMVRMAESMSSVTCETCGAPGTTLGKGWLKTRCDAHSSN